MWQQRIQGGEGGVVGRIERGWGGVFSRLAGRSFGIVCSLIRHGLRQGAVDAAADVKVGPVSTDADGRTVATLTVTNPTAEKHDYTISVSFDDQGGKLLDAVVVNVSGFAGNGSSTATARSNRTLTGATTGKVTAAVRH